MTRSSGYDRLAEEGTQVGPIAELLAHAEQARAATTLYERRQQRAARNRLARELRETVTVGELAELCGVTRSTVQGWLR